MRLTRRSLAFAPSSAAGLLEQLEPRALLTSSFNYDGPAVLGPQVSLSDMVVADFTGDGVADIAAGSGNTILLARGLGNGQFAQAVAAVSLNRKAGRLGTGDFNGDGVADLASVETTDSVQAHPWVRVLLGSASGLSASAYLQIQMQPASLVIGELDGSGAPEIVVTGNDRAGGTMQAFSVVNGSIIDRGRVATGLSLTAPVIARIHGGAYQDLVYGVQDASGWRVVASQVLNPGSSAPTVSLGVSDTVQSVGVGDLREDGTADIVYSTTRSLFNDGILMLNEGRVLATHLQGSALTAATSLYSTQFGGYTPSGMIPAVTVISVADVNSDGRRDIGLEVYQGGHQPSDDRKESETSAAFVLLLGTSAGTYTASTLFSETGEAFNAARPNRTFFQLADVRGTGRQDLLWLRGALVSGTGSVVLVSNTVGNKRPRVSAGSPQVRIESVLRTQTVRFAASGFTADAMRGVVISGFRFYLDVNGDGRVDAGDFLAAEAGAIHGSAVASRVVTSNWPIGSVRVLVVAIDSRGLLSDAVSTTGAITLTSEGRLLLDATLSGGDGLR